MTSETQRPLEGIHPVKPLLRPVSLRHLCDISLCPDRDTTKLKQPVCIVP